ncbi:MAG: hypothetical protein QM639_00670 [Rhodocyclaceae bacterium]|jgi:hypothetical protein
MKTNVPPPRSARLDTVCTVAVCVGCGRGCTVSRAAEVAICWVMASLNANRSHLQIEYLHNYFVKNKAGAGLIPGIYPSPGPVVA